MKQESVVVVGAGILGAATALHLLDEGITDVVLIDRDSVGMGTSNAGAGFVGPISAGWNSWWGEPELVVEEFGMDFYERLAERYDFGFRRDGHLYIARTEASWEQLVPFAEA